MVNVFLALWVALANAQKGPPAPAAKAAPTSTPRIVHVVGDGINYYRVEGAPPPQKPPPGPSVVLNLTPKFEAPNLIEVGKGQQITHQTPPGTDGLAILQAEAARRDAIFNDARARDEAALEEAASWCQQMSAGFRTTQGKVEESQLKCFNESVGQLANGLKSSVSTLEAERETLVDSGRDEERFVKDHGLDNGRRLESRNPYTMELLPNAAMLGVPSHPLNLFSMDAALLPEFGNSASHVATARFPKGTMVYEGASAPQLGMKSGTQFMGGGSQVYVPLPPEEIRKAIITKDVLP